MEKVYKLLHKNYDVNFNKNSVFKRKREDMEAKFKEFNLIYRQDNPLAFFDNEIIYQGILNKQTIENAYFEARNMMDDYYDTLDYHEKQRLMNFEIVKVCNQLCGLDVLLDTIYIPFFDVKMNQIYRNEMVLFDIKKYRYYVTRFENIMVSFKTTYNNAFYNTNFCSAINIYEKDQQLGLYCDTNKCLYFVDNGILKNHLSFSKELNDDQLANICNVFYNKDMDELISILIENEVLKEKEIKKIQKIMKKVNK